MYQCCMLTEIAIFCWYGNEVIYKVSPTYSSARKHFNIRRTRNKGLRLFSTTLGPAVLMCFLASDRHLLIIIKPNTFIVIKC